MHFSKYEGLGNDFILIKKNDWDPSVASERARILCDRHFGIGADGVLVWDDQNPSMRIWNADGSTSEMCGNGLRCVAWALASARGQCEVVEIATDAGAHTCRVTQTSPHTADVEIEMRTPIFGGEDVLRADAVLVDGADGVNFFPVSMGNPHLVTFSKVDNVAEQGPRLSASPLTLRGANISFATLLDRADMRLVVCERGAGFTLACGTGACAAVSEAYRQGLVDDVFVRVRLPGGDLWVRPGTDERPPRMRGPARHVFGGVWSS